MATACVHEQVCIYNSACAYCDCVVEMPWRSTNCQQRGGARSVFAQASRAQLPPTRMRKLASVLLASQSDACRPLRLALHCSAVSGMCHAPCPHNLQDSCVRPSAPAAICWQCVMLPMHNVPISNASKLAAIVSATTSSGNHPAIASRTTTAAATRSPAECAAAAVTATIQQQLQRTLATLATLQQQPVSNNCDNHWLAAPATRNPQRINKARLPRR